MSYRGTQVPAYRSAAGRERNRDRNRKHNPTRHDRRTMHHMQGPAKRRPRGGRALAQPNAGRHGAKRAACALYLSSPMAIGMGPVSAAGRIVPIAVCGGIYVQNSKIATKLNGEGRAAVRSYHLVDVVGDRLPICTLFWRMTFLIPSPPRFDHLMAQRLMHDGSFAF